MVPFVTGMCPQNQPVQTVVFPFRPVMVDTHSIHIIQSSKKCERRKISPFQMGVVICNGAVEMIIALWHQVATGQWGLATPGHGLWPGHRERESSFSRSCTLHWPPSLPKRYLTQLCEKWIKRVKNQAKNSNTAPTMLNMLQEVKKVTIKNIPCNFLSCWTIYTTRVAHYFGSQLACSHS